MAESTAEEEEVEEEEVEVVVPRARAASLVPPTSGVVSETPDFCAHPYRPVVGVLWIV
jgi:hypothetical protein